MSASSRIFSWRSLNTAFATISVVVAVFGVPSVHHVSPNCYKTHASEVDEVDHTCGIYLCVRLRTFELPSYKLISIFTCVINVFSYFIPLKNSFGLDFIKLVNCIIIHHNICYAKRH